MTQLGKYDILEELGRGGFGIVYKALDLSLDRVVALKVLHPQLTVDPSFLERFRKEARALARINHPNVVTIHEIGEVEGRVYIAMEYLPGGSLEDCIAESPLSMKQAMGVAKQVGAGLAAGHEKGLIHRDVKPGNILFNGRGEAVVADFGLAKALELSSSSIRSSRGAVGTPYYRPPELWNGTPPASPATDVYSLACVFYEMISGEILFDGETPMTVMTKHANGPEFPPEISVPKNILIVLQNALSKEPAQRYQSMGQFLSALKTPMDSLNEGMTAISTEGKHQSQTQSGPGQASRDSLVNTFPMVEKASITPEKKTSETSIKKQLFSWLPWVIIGVLVVVFVLVLVLFRFLNAESDLIDAAEVQRAQVEDIIPSNERGIEAEFPTETLPVIEGSAQNEVTNTAQSPTHTTEPTTAEALGVGSIMVNPIDNAELVYVPEGTFIMGSNDLEAAADEGPEHDVYLEFFWIYEHEVTNAQYRRCIENGGCLNRNYTSENNNYPKIYVSWYEAKEYCDWAGGRLPTEAEWEKAAKGTDRRTYPWGNDDPERNLANFNSGTLGTTQPVGSYPSGVSPYGAFDMAGNVMEWVQDWYSAQYYQISPFSDPSGPADGSTRVFRGSSYYASAMKLRVTIRHHAAPSESFDNVGFRCVIEP